MPSDADILRSVRSAISRGEEVIMAVRGRSMIPYLRPGHDEVLLSPVSDLSTLRPGDILLAAVSMEPRISGARTETSILPRLILHRLIDRTPDGQLILMGDGNLHQRETCSPSDIIARVSAIIDTADQSRRIPSRATLWRHLLPLRPVLLRLLSPSG